MKKSKVDHEHLILLDNFKMKCCSIEHIQSIMKGMSVSIIAMFFILFSNALFAKDNDPEAFISSGYSRIENKDYPGAIREFNRAIRIDATYAAAFLGRGRARNLMGEFREALQDFDKAIELNPSFIEAYYLRAELKNTIKDFSGAVTDYNKVLELDPNHHEAFRGKVFSTHFSGNNREAWNLADNALKNNPELAINHYIRGVLQIYRGRSERAIEDLERAFALDPTSNVFNILVNKGNAYLNIKDYDNAIENLTNAIQINPDNASAYNSRGRAYYELRDYELSVSDFRKSSQLAPENDVTFYNLGMAYHRLEDSVNACENFHQSCSRGNKNACRMVLMECAEFR